MSDAKHVIIADPGWQASQKTAAP